MIYLEKAHLVLLRMPKTATHAWRDGLRDEITFIIDDPPQEKHMGLDLYLVHFHKALTQERGTPPEVVICFRHPRAWVNSWYRYRYLPLNSPWADHRPLTRSSFGLSFEEFVSHFVASSGHPAVDIGTQSAILQTKHGRPQLHLFQFEQLDKMQAFFEERLERRLNLPRINAAQDGDGALSGCMEERLKAHLATDYSTWAEAFRA